ncbi:type II toxin-antitoxin system HipA family toxin [uncultured Sphingomonas sp.]|uniref:type II toxin-antitoxin system HipA family toxin n=1 Tax=uncultured Sphingomonas sp. TaxID=158754 RepID=UPI0035CB1B26
MADLAVLLDGVLAGHVVANGNRMSFSYDKGWRHAADAYPLSLSMPLAARDHPHARINAFIWNLLPDNERTLDRWARQFQVSAGNCFALIGAVGEDCAGAVQFVRPDRLDAVLSATEPDIEWLDDRSIGDRLRSVLNDAASGRTAGDNGQFSLAGAQPKTALLFDGGRWGVPAGRTPTTHILKPPARAMPGHAENEHLCLRLAARLGLRTARSEVRRFDGQLAIVVKRYDRIQAGPDGPVDLVRLHQEDMCQAKAVLPWHKYQNEGGPDAASIAALIRGAVHSPMRSGDRIGGPMIGDLWGFVDALIFNWMIGGTDAHAKNYGFLLGADTVRLAPLYDVASAYGFAGIEPQRMKLAMKIGGYYKVEQIVLRHWARWATEAALDPDAVVQRIAALAAALPDALSKVVEEMRGQGLGHSVVDSLAMLLPERAARIARM